MTNKVQNKRSAVAGKAPVTTDLSLGEIAINTHDAHLFVKKDNGAESIVRIGTGDDLPIDINRNGFLNHTDTTISFNDSTRVFTLGAVNTTWQYYRLGIKYTVSGDKTVTIPAVDEQQNFIWIDSTDGSLTTSTSAWNLTTGTMIPVAMVYWDSTQTPKYFLQEERHTCLIDRRQHSHDHFIIGTRAKTIGALSGFSLDTDTNAAKTFAIAESVIIDEDIHETIAELAEPNGTNTDYLVAYRTSASLWKWEDSSMPFKWNTSTNTIQWDNNGTATDATDNQYINSYLILSNIAGKARHLIVPGRTAYTTLAAAQAEDPSTFTFNGFPSAEFVMVYQLTWYANLSGGGADTSSGRCSLIATPKKIAVGAIATSSTAGSVDHNSLSGLQGGIANEYYHLTSTEHTDVALIPGITSNVSTLQSSVTAIEANTSNWNTAYSWGDHSTEGYLTAETDPFFTAWDKSTGISITESQISDLQTYLTAETDPVFLASNAAGILGTDITNWNTAHGWGDHSAAGYALTSSLANVATTGSYTDLSNTPSIPDSILDLGITDGTTGQVLSTDGSGAFTFTDVVSSPGGDDTQFQFNNSGAFSGSSLLTTDGSSVFVSNLQVTNATITNTTSAWQTASNGNLGPVIIGDQITFSSTNDPLNFARNGRMIAGATVTTDGSTYSSVRRSALTTAAVWNHTNGNVTWGNNDRLIGMSSVVTFVGNGATITGVNNGWLNTSNYYTQVNNATVPWAGSGNNYVYALNGAVVQKGYGHKSTFNTNNATIEKFASYVCHLDYMSGTPSVGDTAGLYMGPEYGTSDSFINLSGSVPAQYQTGTNYYLLNNNKTAVSKLGTVKTVDEWVERVSGPEVGTPAAVDLDLSVSNAYEISLNQAGYISELTFSGLNSTTTSSGARMHSATIIFKQDATGGVQVNWPAGTKFAGGIDQIDLTADSVTFVSVMIWDSVYYVTVGVYE